MSEQNVQVVRGAFEAFERGDIEGVLALCDDNILIVQAPEIPVGQPQQRGHAGVREAFGLWPEQWDDYRIEITDVLATSGDQVAVATRQSGRGKQSGVEVEAQFSFLFRLRDAKVTEWRIFVNEDQALAAMAEAES